MSVHKRYMARTHAGFAPGAPVGRIPTFPFDYQVWGGGLSDVYPFAMSYYTAHRLWYGPSVLVMGMSADVGFDGVASTEVVLNRLAPYPALLPDERQLHYPGVLADDAPGTPHAGAFLYSGSRTVLDWNEADGELNAEFGVRLFPKTIVNGSGVDHMLWSPDGTIVVPSMLIEGNIRVTSPSTEFSANVTGLRPQEGEAGEDWLEQPASWLSAHGCGVRTLFFTNPSFTEDVTINLTLSPASWFSHGGRWDTATGAPLF